jgi:hypothetical protein
VNNGIYYSWSPLITAFATQGEKKLLQVAFYSTVTRGAQLFLLLPVSRGAQLLLLHFHVSTVHVNSGEMEVQKKKENEGLGKTGKE